jgi:hypothetical protein
LQQQRIAIMFKDTKKTLHPCPNPQCSSKVFCTEANLNKHFGAKPECAVYAREMCAALLKEAALAEQKLFTPAETVTFQSTQILLPGIPTPNINMENMDDIDFPMADNSNNMEDYYENQDFVNAQYEEFDDERYITTYTLEQKFEICLLKLCTELETPLYAFEEIMNWARHAYLGGYKFLPIQKSYRTQIDKLEKWMGMEDHRPEEKIIEVPGIKNTVDTLKVTRFDFLTQFKSLLDDPVLNRDENLVINSTDRFQKYTPPNGRLGECLSGSWYNHAWDEMEKDGICDFMIPIILYIDKTQVSISGKLSICPVQMSLGIFTEKASSLSSLISGVSHFQN